MNHPSTAAEAVRALRAADQRGQGRVAGPEAGQVTADALAAMEAHARTLRTWNPSVIPGLLQTVPYAAGAIRTALPALPADEVQRRALQRGRRVQAFYERWTIHPAVGHAWFLVGEAAIRQPLVNLHAHAGQLRRLLMLSGLPKVVVQVLPEDVPTPGRWGQFSLYGLEAAVAPEPGADPLPSTRVGYTETPVGGWYTTRSEDIARLYAGFSDMLRVAWSVEDSRRYIEEELETWAAASTPQHHS